VAGELIWLLFRSGQITQAFAFADRAYEKVSQVDYPNAEGVLHYRALMRSDLHDPLDAANQLLPEIDKPWVSRVLRRLLIETSCIYLFNAGQSEQAAKLVADTASTETFQPLLDGLAGDWERYCQYMENEDAARDPNGSRMERCMILVPLAARRRLMGRNEAAEAALLTCLDFTDSADLVCQMSVRSGLGLLYSAEMGRTSEAKVHLARCREIMAAGEDWRGVAGDVARAAAAIAAAEERFIDADTGFAAAVEIFRRYTCPWEESDTYYYWGRALLAAGERDRAAGKFDAGLAIYRRLGAGAQWTDRIEAARAR
jgi:tetratricopeptide (TPR) repeat protein